MEKKAEINLISFGGVNRVVYLGKKAINIQEINEVVRVKMEKQQVWIKLQVKWLKVRVTGCVIVCDDCILKYLKVDQCYKIKRTEW